MYLSSLKYPIRRCLLSAKVSTIHRHPRYDLTTIMCSSSNTITGKTAIDSELKFPAAMTQAVSPHATEQERARDMENQATFLLSLRRRQHQQQYNAKFSKDEYAKLVSETKKVIRFYTDPQFPSRSLSLTNRNDPSTTTTATSTISGGGKIFLKGPLLCHSILTTVMLPIISSDRTIAASHINSIIDMVLRTINSLRTLDNTTSNQQNQSIELSNGDLAEGILRLLLALRLDTSNESSLDEDGSKRATRSRKLLHSYNSTLDVWSKAASSQQQPMVARQAALRAERLLLDLTLSINQKLAQRSEGTTGSSSSRDINPVAETSLDRDTTELLLSYISPDIVSSLQPGRTNQTDNEHADGSSSSMAFAERAESILHLMQDMYDSSLGDGVPQNNVIQPDRRSYDAVIQAWSQCPHPQAPKRAMQLLDKMVERYRSAHGGGDGSRMGTSSIDNQPHSPPPFPSNRTFSSVITAWANSKSPEAIEQAEALFERLKFLGEKEQHICNIEPDTVVFNNLLAVYAKQLNHLRQSAKYSSVENKKVILKKRQEYCYRMEQIFAEMTRLSEERNMSIGREKCALDESTHGTIMRAWINLAKEIPMLKGCIKEGGKKNLKDLHSECLERAEYHLLAAIGHGDDNKKNGVLRGDNYSTKNISIKAFNDLIQLHGTALKPNKAEEIFNLAKSQHPSVAIIDADSFELLVRAFSDYAGEDRGNNGLDTLKKAEELLMRLEKDPAGIRFKSQNLSNMYHSLIHGLAKHAKKDDAVKRVDAILMRMVEKYSKRGDDIAARPARHSFHVVLSSYANLSNNSSSFSKRQHCAKRIEELIKIMEHMHINEQKQREFSQSTGGVAPNVITYNILLSAYSKAIKFANKEHTAKALVQKSEDMLQHMLVTKLTKPDKFSFATVLNVIALSQLKDAGDRASTFVDKLIDFGEREDLDIDTAMMNSVLKAYQRDADERSAVKSENILSQMEKGRTHPDIISYSTVMSVFSKLGTEEAAKSVEHLYHRLKSRCEPDIVAFNYQLLAWSKIGTLEAAQRAEDLLSSLLQYEKEGDNVRPNTTSFSTVLKAYLQFVDRNAVESSEDIVLKMEALRSQDPSIGDTSIYFNWVLKKWGESRCSDHADRSLALLDKMRGLSNARLNKKAEVNQLRIGFNIVMNNFSRVGGENAASKVETIFRSMDKRNCGCHLEPDDFSYSICMATWARSRESIAPRKVKDLLDEMISSFEDGNAKLRPNTHFFDLVLRACSNAVIDDHQNTPLIIALETFGQMKGSKNWAVEMSHTTYSYMLEICKKHISSNDPKQSMLLVKLFEQCCQDGHLNATVLEQFRQCLSKRLFEKRIKIMMEKVGNYESIQNFRLLKDLPSEWSRNNKLSTP